MSEAVASQSVATTAPKGLFVRLVGVLTSPAATYAEVAARPRWLGALVLVVSIYARESMSSPSMLAVFLPFLDDDTFVARLLGAIDLFVIWWTVSLAVGLGVLYKRRTVTIATTLLALYSTIAIVIAAVKTTLSGA